MGFMDKVKETAAKAGEAAKDAGKAKKKISDLKEELGGVVFAQRTGAANPAGDASFDATVDRLVAEITEQEAALAAIGETPAD
jgi:hypothetical protein